MFRSFAVMCAVAAVALSAPAAAAPRAPRVPCNLVTDAKNDVRYGPVRPPAEPYADPRLDIHSADLAADGRRVTAVLRIGTGASTVPVPPGTVWTLRFGGVGGRMAALVATEGHDGIKYGVYYYDVVSILTSIDHWEKAGEATGSMKSGQVTITADWSAFGGQKPALGTELNFIAAVSERWAMPADRSEGYPTLWPDDPAPTDKKYKIGTATCVKVGG